LLALAQTARDDVESRLRLERDRLLASSRASVAEIANRDRLTSVPVAQFDDLVRPRPGKRRDVDRPGRPAG